MAAPVLLLCDNNHRYDVVQLLADVSRVSPGPGPQGIVGTPLGPVGGAVAPPTPGLTLVASTPAAPDLVDLMQAQRRARGLPCLVLPPAEAAPLLAPPAILPEVARLGGIIPYVQAKLKGAAKPELAALAAGQSIAAAGDRDAALLRVTAAVANLAVYGDPDVESHELLDLFVPSLTVWANEPGATKGLEDELAKVTDKLDRALAKFRTEVVQQRTVEEGALAELRRHALRGATPAVKEIQGPSGPYKPETLAHFCTQQSKLAGTEVSLDAWRKRWIIQCCNTYYVYSGGVYKTAIPFPDLQNSLFRDLCNAWQKDLDSPAAVDFYTPTAKGDSLRLKTEKEMVRDYGTVARRVVANLALQESYYDPADETFYEAVTPLRQLEGVYSADVARWLELLAGKEVETLLDWIATAPDLSRQTAALVLTGPKGGGKTLIANALAALWTRLGPARLKNILGNFNDALTRCPVIFADEAMPKGSLADLRELTGSSVHTLSRKFMPTAQLLGCVRVVLAANNESILTASGENLSQDDEAAIADRILHIRTDGQAATFLESFGSANGPRRWMQWDLIVKHFVWLAATRQVAKEGRFLVTGKMTEIHRFIGMQGVRAHVAEFLAGYLDNPTPLDRVPGAVRCGDAAFYITTEAVCAHWELYNGAVKVPAKKLVGAALKHLAVPEEGEEAVSRYLIQGRRAHRIRHQFVIDWANHHHIADAVVMQQTTTRPLAPVPGAPTAATVGGGA